MRRVFVLGMLLLPMLWQAGHADAREYRAAVVRTGFPGESPALVRALDAQVKAAGYTVTRLSAGDLCDPERLSASRIDLLVLPDASTLPLKSRRTVDAYLRGGGDLIALRTPMWRRTMVSDSGKWVTSEQYARAHALDLPENTVCGFSPGSTSRWSRSTDNPGSKSVYESVTGGRAGRRVLHVTVPDLKGWDTFATPEMGAPFPSGHSLTILSAKGDGKTPLLSVEWTEADGARWVAVVRLSTEWRRYVLKPSDFIYWPSAPGRGAPGDSLKTGNARKLAIGLSFSHTGWNPGRHEYWVGPVGTAPISQKYDAALDAFRMPPLDQLYPAYKLFDCHDVAGLRIVGDQSVVSRTQLPTPIHVSSPQPRTKGGGFDKGRAWRWIPLVEARTASGEWRGNPITMTANVSGEYKGSVWASFGVEDASWYASSTAIRLVGQVASKMRDGVFIIDGGTNYFTYFPDQTPKLGVRVVNLSPEERSGLSADVRLGPADRRPTGGLQTTDHRLQPRQGGVGISRPVSENMRASRVTGGSSSPPRVRTVVCGLRSVVCGPVEMQRSWAFALAPGEERVFSESVKPSSWPNASYVAVADVTSGGRIIDRVSHDVYVRRPKKTKEFVTVKDGEFVLRGRRWRAHGVNYWPSSSIGCDDADYASLLFSAATYDPEVTERDLTRIQKLGLNSVSTAFMSASIDSQNLLDFLRRCENHGLKVNLHLGAYINPMGFKWPPIKQIIDRNRLQDDDTVFAYDLAWELNLGNHESRRRWDSDWQAWVVERYGSIESAEKDWGFGIPRDESGKVTNPEAKQFETDGPWRRMVAAYRRFADTLSYRKWYDARRRVRATDPDHLISFRWTESGNPTFKSGEYLCFDFPYMSAAVDFFGPEAYGRIGNREMVKPAAFEFAYARWANPTLPMVWTEAGFPVWDINSTEYSPTQMKAQGTFFQDLYDVMTSTGQNGIFFWWYPGGFRCGEASDFGIINPDGSDRPLTAVIRRNARRFLDGPSARRSSLKMQIDCDARSTGLTGAYDGLKDRYWKAVAQGKTPGLVTAGTGTTSANCPLVAVGNTPCNGTNPPKYLDGLFDSIEISDADGKWVPVTKDSVITVRRGQRVVARATLVNLGEAGWTSSGKGCVAVMVNGIRSYYFAIPHPVARFSRVTMENMALTPYGIREPLDLTLGLSSLARTDFGERVKIRLRIAD